MKSLFLCLLLASMSASAGSEFDHLREVAVEKFLGEANNPKTKLGKRIDEINVDTTDGRNSDGTITLPLTENEIQVSVQEGVEMYNPWHYADKSEDEKSCIATANSASFLFLISGREGVHGAEIFHTYPFNLTVTEIQTAKRKDGGKIEYCEDVMTDSENEFEVPVTSFSFSEITEAKGEK